MSHIQPEETTQIKRQSQVNDLTITEQPTDPVPPVIPPEVNPSSELALLVAFAMAMAVFAKAIK